MKYRISFITNSSSSNYLLVCTDNGAIIEKLLEMEGESFDSIDCVCGIHEGSVINFYGRFSEILYAGIDASDLLEDMNMKEVREYFKQLLKKEYSIDINLKDIEIFYGLLGND